MTGIFFSLLQKAGSQYAPESNPFRSVKPHQRRRWRRTADGLLDSILSDPSEVEVPQQEMTRYWYPISKMRNVIMRHGNVNYQNGTYTYCEHDGELSVMIRHAPSRLHRILLILVDIVIAFLIVIVIIFIPHPDHSKQPICCTKETQAQAHAKL